MYVSIAPNGRAMISTKPPVDEFYVEVDALPEGDGPLMLSADGTLYRLPAPQSEPEREPTEMEQLRADIDFIAMEMGVDL